MAGSATVTFKESPAKDKLDVRIEWTSDASGDCTKELIAEYESWSGLSGRHLVGFLEYIETIPDGTDTPTDNYSITILNGDSTDLSGGAWASNRSASSNQITKPSTSDGIPTAIFIGNLTALTFTVASAGASKKGVAILHLNIPK